MKQEFLSVGDAMPKKQANPVDAQVGHRVRLRRILVGMSQEKLGEMLGLTFQQVQKYEKGVNRIGAGRLYQISHILGVHIGYFYEDVSDYIPPDAKGSEPGATHSVVEFLSSGDGLKLCHAFTRIKDPKVRKRVLELVTSLTDGEEKSRQ